MRLQKRALNDLELVLRDVWRGVDRVEGKPPA